MKFKVTFTEEGRGIFTRTCDVPNEAEVIRIYGLNEPDILDYHIEPIE